MGKPARAPRVAPDAASAPVRVRRTKTKDDVIAELRAEIEQLRKHKGFANGIPRSSRKKRDPLELYETPACATHALVAHEPLDGVIWEPCCGRGAISNVLTAAGLTVVSTDLAHRDFGRGGVDFFKMDAAPFGTDVIVTNPPYGRADDFIRHGLKLAPVVLVLLRWAYAEGENKSDVIDGHLEHVWLGRERLPMMHRDGWTGPMLKDTATPFAWFRFVREPRRVAGAKPGSFTVTRISWTDGEAVTQTPPPPVVTQQIELEEVIRERLGAAPLEAAKQAEPVGS